jgi:hypothetical protein
MLEGDSYTFQMYGGFTAPSWMNMTSDAICYGTDSKPGIYNLQLYTVYLLLIICSLC